MAVVKTIDINSVDSHQSSPSFVATFLRWSNRSTFNYEGDPLEVRNPLVVYSDAISVGTTDNKSSHLKQATITLKGGDINYATAIAGGDYCVINLVNWPSKAEEIRNRALRLQPINKVDDGFKGVYKVQDVYEQTRTSKNGVKTITYQVTLLAFTEFDNEMYFNPAIAQAFRETGTLLYQTIIGEKYQELIKALTDVQTFVKVLFKILIGKNRQDKDPKLGNFNDNHFKIPPDLGRLLGRPSVVFAGDIFNYILGIWSSNSNNNGNLQDMLNPDITAESEGNYYKTSTQLQGNKIVNLENWNQKTAWSIISSDINSVLNEIYTTHRVSPEGNVMPTIVVRQKPFTTPHFQAPQGFPTTRYFDIPRWRLSPNMVIDATLGKTNSARKNFVQVYTRTVSDIQEQNMAEQIQTKNFVVDDGDIQKHGLKPYIVTSNFDWPIPKAGTTQGENKRLRAKEWAQIVSDWIIDGHLKMNGTINCIGIEDPISVGDNLEYNNVVYHIENVKHTYKVGANGTKKFRTTISVSYGMDLRSSKSQPVYSEMEHTDRLSKQQEDWENERIMPGFSDTQDLDATNRKEGEEIFPTPQRSFTPNNPQRQRSKRKNTGEKE